MDLAADLPGFFADFGVDATLGGNAVRGIFDNAYATGGVGMLGMATTQTALTLASADVPADPVGASVLVGSAVYVVAASEPDGTGITRLLLEVAV